MSDKYTVRRTFMKFTRAQKLHGEVTIPGDKSISHRTVMFGSLAEGTTEVTGFLRGADCLSTIDCFRRLGISIEDKGEQILIHGKGLHGLSAPSAILDAGNSGTTTRLISGILSGQNFETTLTGDASIQKRPMGRIIEPLSQMGAAITSLSGNGCAPLRSRTALTWHSLYYKGGFRSGEVFDSAGRTLRRRAHQRDGTCTVPKSFGADAAFLRSGCEK